MTRRFPLWLTGFILLTGCRTNQSAGLSGLTTAVISFLVLVLLLLLIWLVYHAERRWQLLQLIRPSRWLRKISRFREAKALERQMNTITQVFKRFQKFIPGLKNINIPQMPGKGGKHGRSRSAMMPDVKKLQKSGQKLSGMALPAMAEQESVTEVVAEPAAETEATAVSPAPVAPAPPPPAEPDEPETTIPVTPTIGQPTGQTPPIDARDLTGCQFDRYRIDAKIGHSSYQTTYQGMDCKLGRPVRIYQIPLPPGSDPAQLQAHMQAIARLSHPAIALVHDTFIQTENAIIVYEYIAAQSSADFLAHMQAQGTPVSLPHLLALAAQIAEGLAAAHKVGIVHGRLHPDHIFITPAAGDIPWQAKITGFGLASLLPPRPPYQPPEQTQEQADASSDLFALGAVLHRWVTGQLPTSEATPTQLRPALPPEVEQVILRAMSVNPAERYADAGEMAAVLRTLARQLTVLYEQEQLMQQAQSANVPVLYILCAGERPRAVPLTKEKLFIGSALDNEVYLPSRAVEPCHAQLKKSLLGWQVTDLGSANGSFVAGARLLPQVGEEWDERQSLVVGPYTLVWTAGGGALANWLETVEEQSGAAVQISEAAAMETAVSLQLTPQSTEVNPGDTATFSLFVRNNSTQVDHFHIEVGGVPASWLLISDNDVQLMPGDGYTLLLAVTPPLDHTAAAGEYPLQLWASPKTNPVQAARADALLTVRPFTRVTGVLEPAKIRNKGTACLTLTNLGNVATAVSLLPVSGAEEGVMMTLPEPVTLLPGETMPLEIPVWGKRPFLGSHRLLPFSLKTVASGDETQHNGQLELRPYLPVWLIPLFAFLFLIALFLFNYWQNQAQLAQTNAIATQMAAPTPRPPATPAIPVSPTPIPFPATCAEIKTNQPDAIDGEYTLFVQHNEAMPVAIYCAGMDGVPAAYLSLPQDEDSNYATARYPAHELLTRFERVRIDLHTLVIDPTDRTFSITTGSLPDDLAEPYYNDFGSALGCRSESGADVVGRANINLQGTGFALAETAVFLVEGQDVSPDSGVTISEDRMVAEMQVSGLCGWIRPFNGIPLVYTGTN